MSPEVDLLSSEGRPGVSASAISLDPFMPARLRRGLHALVLAVTVLVVIAPATERLASTNPSPSATEVAEKAYADLPLSFVPNRGQAGEDVLYSAQAGGFAVQFTQREARLAFVGEEQGHVLGLRFVGANTAPTVVGRAPAPGKVNYLIG